MLGHFYRWRASNTQNQPITVTLKVRPWKFSSTGAIVYGAEQTPINAQLLGATTGTYPSATIDNSGGGDLYIGAELLLSCTASATTNGTGVVAITLERSTDGGTTWATAGQGEFVGGYTVTATDATTTKIKNLTVD